MKQIAHSITPTVALPAALSVFHIRPRPKRPDPHAGGSNRSRRARYACFFDRIIFPGAVEIPKQDSPQRLPLPDEPKRPDRLPVNSKRYTRPRKIFSILLGALAITGVPIIFWITQNPEKTQSSASEPVAEIGKIPRTLDSRPDTMRFFLFQPPEEGREFVQLGSFSTFLLKPSSGKSPAEIIDPSGQEFPNWVLAQQLDLGGYIVVVEPMEKLIIHLACGMNRWPSRDAQIVTLQELVSMEAE